MKTKRPRISEIHAARAPFHVSVKWEDGGEDVIDLTETVHAFKAYAPLRDEEHFNCVRVGEWGWHIEWADGEDMAADTLWRLALEQKGEAMAPKDFRTWRAGQGLSLTRTAVALGISRRMAAYYDSGQKIIPKYIRLACLGASLEMGPK